MNNIYIFRGPNEHIDGLLEIESIIWHPRYINEPGPDGFNGYQTAEYNIALVKLKEPLTFSSKISPLCLPTRDNLGPLYGRSWDSKQVHVTGWGAGKVSDVSIAHHIAPSQWHHRG